MKKIKELLMGILIGGIVFGGIGVAAVTLKADEVKYIPSNEEFNVDNAKDAMDELYNLLKTSTGKNKLAIINSVKNHEVHDGTTGMTTDEEYFTILHANDLIDASSNTVTINKKGNYRITLMISEIANDANVTLYVNDTPTIFTKQGVTYDNVLELNVNDKITVTLNGAINRAQSLTLVVTAI